MGNSSNFDCCDAVKITDFPSFPEHKLRPGGVSQADYQALPELGQMHFWLLGRDAQHREYMAPPTKIKGLPAWGPVRHAGSVSQDWTDWAGDRGQGPDV